MTPGVENVIVRVRLRFLAAADRERRKKIMFIFLLAAAGSDWAHGKPKLNSSDVLISKRETSGSRRRNVLYISLNEHVVGRRV